MRIYDELCTFTPCAADDKSTTYEESVSWVYGRQTTTTGSSIQSLSWGIGGELLVGSDRLSLFHLSSQSHELRNTWNFPLSAQVEYAIFSPDANLIASYGRHDKLVKIWRRLSDRVSSNGAKSSDFDFIYLSHTRAVDGVRWRQPFYEDLVVDNVAYTTSIDQKFRVWASDIPHDSHLLTLHESLSLESESDRDRKIAVVLDDDVFSWALTKATKRGAATGAQRKAKVLLDRISKGQPEVVLTMGLDGSMEAHALHNLGGRNHNASTQELFFRTASTAFLTDVRATEHLWITADIQRHKDFDLLFFIGQRDSIAVYQIKLFDLFSDKMSLDPVNFLEGHQAAISSLGLHTDGIISSTDVDDNQRNWTVYEKRLRSAKAVDETQVPLLNGHQAPSYISSVLNATIQLTSTSSDFTGIVTATQANVVQIWGEDLVSSFSGAPETYFCLTETVVDLAWEQSYNGTPDLAVCTKHSIHLLKVYPVLSENSTRWRSFWFFDLSKLTKQDISQVIYSQSTKVLVVSAGAQIYTFSASDWDTQSSAPEVVHHTIPVYHPVFLKQMLRLGKFSEVRNILTILYDKLVHLENSMELQSDLNLSQEQLFEMRQDSRTVSLKENQYGALFGTNEGDSSPGNGLLSASKASSLCKLLSDLSIPGLGVVEKRDLDILIDALVRIAPDESSLDTMGARFYLSYVIMKSHNVRFPELEQVNLSDEDVLWASKSDKQDILFTLVRSLVSSLTWTEARAAKVFRWLSDRNALLEAAEIVAKAEFLRGESRDPVSASIWYHALHKKATLLGLWRMSGAHPEHNLTTRILANDFEESKWRTAANKNAYALVGRRRYEYAAAWFLLAGSLKDAVHVCVRNAEDLDLALAIARIWEAGINPTLSSLLHEDFQAIAHSTGSRALACWSSEFVLKYELSMQQTTSSFGLQARDTPALLIIYEFLRNRQGAIEREEQFLEYVIHLLNIRGCQRISRYLQQTWKPQEPASSTNNPSAVQKEVTLEEYRAEKKEQLSQAPQAVYQEPTMDSFAGFDF